MVTPAFSASASALMVNPTGIEGRSRVQQETRRVDHLAGTEVERHESISPATTDRPDTLTEEGKIQRAALRAAGTSVAEQARASEMPEEHRHEVARGGRVFPGLPPAAPVPGPKEAERLLPALLGMDKREFDEFRETGTLQRYRKSLVKRPVGSFTGPSIATLRESAPLLKERVPNRKSSSPRNAPQATSAHKPRTSVAKIGSPVTPAALSATPTAPHPSGQASLSLSARSRPRSPKDESVAISRNGGGGFELSPDLMNIGVPSNPDQYGTSYFMAFFMRHGRVMGETKRLLGTLRKDYDDLARLDRTKTSSRRRLEMRRELGRKIGDFLRQQSKSFAMGGPDHALERFSDALSSHANTLMGTTADVSSRISAISNKLVGSGRAAINSKIGQARQHKGAILAQVLSIAGRIHG